MTPSPASQDTHAPVLTFGVWMSAIAGVMVWITVTAYGARQEAWDSSLYYLFGMPGLTIMSTLMAYLNPVRPWRYALAPYVGQAIVGLALNPSGVLPLGLFLFPVLSIPGLVLAYLAAALKSGLLIRIPIPGRRIRITDKTMRQMKLDDIMKELEQESQSGRTDPGEESSARKPTRDAQTRPQASRQPPKQR